MDMFGFFLLMPKTQSSVEPINQTKSASTVLWVFITFGCFSTQSESEPHVFIILSPIGLLFLGSMIPIATTMAP